MLGGRLRRKRILLHGINYMRKLVLYIWLLAFNSLVISQNIDIEKNIDSIVDNWIFLISEMPQSRKTYYKYLFRENDRNIYWSSTEIQDNSLILIQKIAYLKNEELGSLVCSENFTVSGDWYIVQNDYSSIEGKIICTKWEMNTCKAEFPITVNKKIYFNYNGTIYSQYRNIYKFNIQDIVSIKYQDVDVNYRLQINDLEFLQLNKIK